MTHATTQPRHVSAVLSERGKSANASQRAPSTLTHEHIARLWQRMTAIYGHRWVSSYGADDADDTWLRGLSGILPTEIARGLEACCTKPDGWPPPLPEFRAMCRPPADRREHGAMYRDFPPALPPPRDPAKARAALDAMRAKIRGAA